MFEEIELNSLLLIPKTGLLCSYGGGDDFGMSRQLVAVKGSSSSIPSWLMFVSLCQLCPPRCFRPLLFREKVVADVAAEWNRVMATPADQRVAELPLILPDLRSLVC